MENYKDFVFIINGHNGAGKDTFVEKFKKAVCNEGMHYAVNNISTIDPIKEMINIPCLWNGITKDDAARQLMHDIKEAVDKYSDYTTKYVVRKTIEHNEAMLNSDRVQHRDVSKYVGIPKDDTTIRTVTFIHCREPEKIRSIYRSFNERTYKRPISVETILVRRDSDDIASNAADQNVEDFMYDYYIDNNGTLSDLFDAALALKRKCDAYSDARSTSPYLPYTYYYND